MLGFLYVMELKAKSTVKRVSRLKNYRPYINSDLLNGKVIKMKVNVLKELSLDSQSRK